MRGLSFTADGEYFAADVTLVQQVARNLELTPVPAAPDEVAGIANIKGRVITVLSVAALLGRPREKYARTVHAVIFKSGGDAGSQTGLIIDKPGDLLDIDESRIITPELFSGADGAKENFCIHGAAEIESRTGKRFYRIINLELIINKFKDGSAALQGGISDYENF